MSYFTKKILGLVTVGAGGYLIANYVLIKIELLNYSPIVLFAIGSALVFVGLKVFKLKGPDF